MFLINTFFPLAFLTGAWLKLDGGCVSEKLRLKIVLNLSYVCNICSLLSLINNKKYMKTSTLTHFRIHSLLLSLPMKIGARLWHNGHFHGNKLCDGAWKALTFDGE